MQRSTSVPCNGEKLQELPLDLFTFDPGIFCILSWLKAVGVAHVQDIFRKLLPQIIRTKYEVGWVQDLQTDLGICEELVDVILQILVEVTL